MENHYRGKINQYSRVEILLYSRILKAVYFFLIYRVPLYIENRDLKILLIRETYTYKCFVF